MRAASQSPIHTSRQPAANGKGQLRRTPHALDNASRPVNQPATHVCHLPPPIDAGPRALPWEIAPVCLYLVSNAFLFVQASR
mmetsp:Transcript_30306/g.88077  ORF Transcript_30306/g.88077 Transcript_30306/m.88077 type:complete len:82 (+) Transcript_30306:53-298(+)